MTEKTKTGVIKIRAVIPTHTLKRLLFSNIKVQFPANKKEITPQKRDKKTSASRIIRKIRSNKSDLLNEILKKKIHTKTTTNSHEITVPAGNVFLLFIDKVNNSGWKKTR